MILTFLGLIWLFYSVIIVQFSKILCVPNYGEKFQFIFHWSEVIYSGIFWWAARLFTSGLGLHFGTGCVLSGASQVEDPPRSWYQENNWHGCGGGYTDDNEQSPSIGLQELCHRHAQVTTNLAPDCTGSIARVNTDRWSMTMLILTIGGQPGQEVCEGEICLMISTWWLSLWAWGPDGRKVPSGGVKSGRTAISWKEGHMTVSPWQHLLGWATALIPTSSSQEKEQTLPPWGKSPHVRSSGLEIQGEW